MFGPRSRAAQESAAPTDELRELAQRKVQLALQGFSTAADAPAPPDPSAPDPASADPAVPVDEPSTDHDPLVEQALDRLRAELGDVVALDGSGHTVQPDRLARLLIGPLATRLRDVETAEALTEALAETVDRHAPAYPVAVGTGWPR